MQPRPGKTITRDQSLVALGYIAGQLGVFMQLQGNGQQQAPDDDLGPTPQAVPAPQPAPQANNQLPPEQFRLSRSKSFLTA